MLINVFKEFAVEVEELRLDNGCLQTFILWLFSKGAHSWNFYWKMDAFLFLLCRVVQCGFMLDLWPSIPTASSAGQRELSYRLISSAVFFLVPIVVSYRHPELWKISGPSTRGARGSWCLPRVRTRIPLCPEGWCAAAIAARRHLLRRQRSPLWGSTVKMRRVWRPHLSRQ